VTKTEIARSLRDWFRDVLVAYDKFYSSMATGPKHRKIILWSAISRTATSLASLRLDDRGRMFSQGCLALGATCLYLEFRPDAGNWLAAIENVLSLGPSLEEARSVVPGIEFSSPVDVFKDQVDTAFANAGVVAGRPSSTDSANREIALNLAGNWILKLLVALALESEGAVPDSSPAAPAFRRAIQILRPLAVGT
jgi:hypothetical protein